MIRTHFNSSNLIRVLADLELVGTTGSGPTFAENLGQWVSFTDAITLSEVHSRAPTAPSRKRLMHIVAIADEVANTRAGLVHLITRRGMSRGQSPIPLPEPPDTATVSAAAFEPYRRFYSAHQREMEASLSPLRARLRAVLAHMSPKLIKLATLDATLENILSERESKLLAKVASLMQKRFMHLFRTQQLDLQSNEQAWLERFCHELQTVLLAELDLRLQPALGMLEAFQTENNQTL